MQENDYSADRIYGGRDSPEGWKVQVLWKTHLWHLDMKHPSETLPFSCPVCGRKKDYLLKELFEGAVLTCPFCKLTLTLHGHMWRDVQKEIQKLKDDDTETPS
jgi:hypothetical protein